jgi:hypothetical protein
MDTVQVEDAFAFLERHWPRLVNAIESHHIPKTNNTTEQVIRIFTQHYKTFCGFENVQSAWLYLGVLEKVYRFTPLLKRRPAAYPGQVPPRTGRLSSAETANGSTIPRAGPPVTCRSLSGACPQYVTVATV